MMRRGDGVGAHPDGVRLLVSYRPLAFMPPRFWPKTRVLAVILPQDSRETLRTARATNGGASAVCPHLCAAKYKRVLTTSQHEDAFRGDIAAQRCDRRAEGLQRCRGRSFWHLPHPRLAVRWCKRGCCVSHAYTRWRGRDARVCGQRQQQQPPRHRCDGSVPTGT